MGLRFSTNPGLRITSVDSVPWSRVTGTKPASDITATPSGNLSSDTVEGQIVELDTEKLATGDLVSVIAGADLTKVSIVSGTLASAANAFTLTGTLSATSATQTGVQYTITGAGTDANNHVAFGCTLAAGYTGAGISASINAGNTSLGTGVTLIPATNSNIQLLNSGSIATATGANVTGYNVGVVGKASNSVLNAGGLFLAQVNINSGTNIGVVASAYNGGTSPVQIGIFGGLNASVPTVSAAAIFDNGVQTDPILRLKDNGTDVLSVNDGGTVTMSAALAASMQAGIAYPFIVGGSVAVDFNAANTDHSITITSPTTNYRIQGVVIINTGTAASLTTARGGLFTTTGGGGTAAVADQVLTALTSNAANTASSLTNLASAVNTYWNRTGANSFYWRTSTAQGAAATGKVYVMIQPLP